MARCSVLKRPSALFLRRHRRCPHSTYRARWQQMFDQRQAMRSLKQAANHPHQSHLLSSLLHSFAAYNVHPTPQAYHFVLKSLAQNLQFPHIASVLDRLQRLEKFQTPEYIFAHLIKSYAHANKLQEAVDLFFSIPHFRCAPSVYSLNTLLSVLCRNERGLKLVPDVLLKTHPLNVRVDESTFRILVKSLCKINKVSYAIEMLNSMINDGLCIDDKIFSCLLASVCAEKQPFNLDVLVFFENLRKLGFCPGLGDYTNVIRFLVINGSALEALDALNQMKSDGIKPDIACYTMVLRGAVAVGDYTTVDDLFDELLVLGLVPDVYTYNAYIERLCKQSNVEDGIKMVSAMEKLGCKPNLATYNMLLNALCKSGELSQVRELVGVMKVKGIQLNLQTYKVVIDGFISKGDIVQACKLVDDLLENCFCCQNSTFDEVICSLCQRGLVCEASEVLRKTVGRRIFPGTNAWEALLDSCVTRSDFAGTTLIELVDPI